MEDRGRGRNCGRGRERGVDQPHPSSLQAPGWGSCGPLEDNTASAHQNLGELQEENRSLLFRSRCNQRRNAATALPRAAVSLCAPLNGREFNTLAERERSIYINTDKQK